jgi:hypothetical protein
LKSKYRLTMDWCSWRELENVSNATWDGDRYCSNPYEGNCKRYCCGNQLKLYRFTSIPLIWGSVANLLIKISADLEIQKLSISRLGSGLHQWFSVNVEIKIGILIIYIWNYKYHRWRCWSLDAGTLIILCGNVSWLNH